MIGTTLNHFKILDRLGKGGMGEAYYVAEEGRIKVLDFGLAKLIRDDSDPGSSRMPRDAVSFS